MELLSKPSRPRTCGRQKTPTPPVATLDLPVDGERILVVTMATWCQVCRGEIPHLARLAEAMGDKIKFYGFPIDPEDSPEKLARYKKDAGPVYDILGEVSAEQRAAIDNLMTKQFGERPLPSSFVLDGNGNVLRAQKGVPTLSELRLLKR